MTLTLTAEQSAEVMPLYLSSQEAGGGLMLGIDRASFDQPDAGKLVLRARVISGDQKQAIKSALAKVKAKEAKI